MKLVVGLGNPGEEYRSTRHNVGFMVLDSFLGDVLWQKKFNGEFYKTMIENEPVIFLKPLTFMNLSGQAVQQFAHYYHIDITDILIIHDDLDLPLGSYKLKRNSSSGGHNGLKSIISCLNSESFLRLKVGVTYQRGENTIDFVLGRFSKKEKELLEENYGIYHKVIRSFILSGVEKTLVNYSKK
ncbi:MAG: aminoacyl-tRNA hydrolase [Bacilli bacterium]|nr:aminoacyl-tRNA hydrolase [Bacilli bacterium]